MYGLITMRNPKGGFYTEYAAVNGKQVWPIPANLILEEAGVMPIDAGTVLRGLRDVLALNIRRRR